MKIDLISIAKAEELNLKIITYFKPNYTTDKAMKKAENMNIGTKAAPIIVDCDMEKRSREYNHFQWLEDLAKQIKKDPKRIVCLVENSRKEQALAVDPVPY